MTKVPLNCIARTLYCVYYAKAALALLQPSLLQEYSDFCIGCNLGSDGGSVAAAFEAAWYFFLGLLYTAVAQFDDDKCIRKVLQYGMVLPGLKLAALVKYGLLVEADPSTGLLVAAAENLMMVLGATLVCYVWYPSKVPKKNKHGLLEIFTFPTAIRTLYIEQLAVIGVAVYTKGMANELTDSSTGTFAFALEAATQIGFAVALQGVAQCDDADQKKVVQYSMLKRVTQIFVLLPLAVGASSDLMMIYVQLLWGILALTHSMCVCYYGPKPRAVFWAASLTAGFLGTTGLLFAPSTAALIYNVPKLDEYAAPATAFRLIGLGCVMVATALASFAQDFKMEAMESTYVYAYGPVCVYKLVANLYLGLFSDLANVFLLWCMYQQFSELVGGWMPKSVSTAAKKAVSSLSPKAAKRGRSRTPAGRKSQ